MTNIDQLMAEAAAAHRAGRFTQAEQLYVQVVQREPRHARALHGLGFLAGQTGRTEDAIRLMRQSIAIDPSVAEYYNNLANMLGRLGHFEEASEAYRKAVELRPGFWEAWFNLATALRQQGQDDAAIESCRRCIAINPRCARAHNELGSLLGRQGGWQEAEACYRAAIAADVRLPEAHANLAEAILRTVDPARAGAAAAPPATGHDAERVAEAVGEYRRTIELRTSDVSAHSNLGNLLGEIGKLDEAIEYHRRATALDPNCAEAHYNLGLALDRVAMLEEAEAAYRRAIELRPDLVMAHNNLGTVLLQQWQPNEAIEQRRRAMALRPDDPQLHSNLLLHLHYDLKHDAPGIFGEHRRWAERHAAGPMSRIRAHGNSADPGRRLRIGYLSPDFRQHSVAFFLEPVLASHDPGRFEVFAYSSVRRPDEVSRRLATLVHHWREVWGKPDEEVAELIGADGIDILVDLAGHTADNRLLVLAYKPAPVQMTYLGYPNTTGLATVDYRITDAIADPPGTTEACHSERLLRLGGCFLCYRPREDAPDVAELPARRCGQVTFGCFNNIVKIREETLRLWAGILRAVPGSRLLLKDRGFASAQARARVLAALAREGIGAERVELQGYESDYAKHLALYARMDVALDTFPYCGTTTTCDAMWMGVPVVSLAGRTHVSRVGCTLLTAAGLPELAAASEAAYVQIAQNLAMNLDKLAELRAGLRQRMRSSPLLDAAGFTRGLESAYRSAWTRWCEAAPAAGG